MTFQCTISEMTPVRDQKQGATCLAFATSAAHEHLKQINEHMSPAYLYGLAWKEDSTLNGKNGLTVEAVKRSLSKQGQIFEAFKPYDAWLQSNEYPGIDKVSDKEHFKSKVTNIANSYSDIKDRIIKGIPVILGLKIGKSFRAPDRNGLIDDRDVSNIGGHAVLAVGVSEDQNKKTIQIRNSWGNSWGKQGYAYITDKYINDRLFASAILEKHT
jgi:C1A family cysteine protease